MLTHEVRCTLSRRMLRTHTLLQSGSRDRLSARPRGIAPAGLEPWALVAAPGPHLQSPLPAVCHLWGHLLSCTALCTCETLEMLR